MIGSQVTVYTSYHQKEELCSGIIVGYGSQGDEEIIFPVAIIMLEDGTVDSYWLTCIKVETGMRFA